jgi:hypothetical protein
LSNRIIASVEARYRQPVRTATRAEEMSSHSEDVYEFRVGEPIVIESPAGNSPYVVVFEDDGQTAYFYGLDTRQTDQPILDALHIYNAANVADSAQASGLQIGWSEDGNAATLLINGYAHAMFDFQTPRAMCATGFPPQSPYVATHDWDEAAYQQTFPGVASEWAWRQANG